MWGVWAGFVGCVAPVEVEARFAQTQAECGLHPMPLDAEIYVDPPALDEECAAAVLDDFHADVDSLADAGTLDTLLQAAAALMTVDLGPLRALPGSPVAEALRETAEVTGGEQVAELLYDYAAGRFTAVVGETDPDVHASVDTRSGVLAWAEVGAAGIDAAALLVHEARHRDGFDHVPCGSGGARTCDAGTDGPWGFQLVVHALAREAADDPFVADAEAAWIARVAEGIR